MSEYQFEVGKKYKENGDSYTEYTFVKMVSDHMGEFVNNDGTSHCFLGDMALANLDPEFEFEFGEEIEVDSYEDFRNPVVVKFKHQNPNGDYWGVDKLGWLCRGKYARKIERKGNYLDNYITANGERWVKLNLASKEMNILFGEIDNLKEKLKKSNDIVNTFTTAYNEKL